MRALPFAPAAAAIPAKADVKVPAGPDAPAAPAAVRTPARVAVADLARAAAADRVPMAVKRSARMRPAVDAMSAQRLAMPVAPAVVPLRATKNVPAVAATIASTLAEVIAPTV